MNDYKKQIADVKKGIDDLGDRLLAQTSLAVLGQVVMATPVDTGRARSNWHLDVDKPVRTTTEDTTSQNLEEGRAASETVKGDDTVYISNNLPYIERLNDGHSKQAPANFVESAAIIARRKIAEIAKRGLRG